MSRRALCLTAAALAATAWGVHRLARRSGVSPDEAGHSLPGDQIVPGPN